MNASAAISRYNANDPVSKRSRLTINGPLGVSLIALILGASVIAAGAATVLTTVFALSLGEEDPQRVLAQLDEAHQKKIAEDKERFTGRSIFFKPPPPPRPIPEVVRETPRVEPPPPPTTPPIPANYTGPSISYALGDAICFKPDRQNDKQFTVRVGEEANGVRVIAMNLPWSVKLGHMGGEYDVNIFKYTDESKYLPTQARPTAVVRGLIEVPPPQLKVPAIQAPDDGQIIQSAATAENLERAREARINAAARPRPGARQGAAAQAHADREARRVQQEEAGEVEEEDAEVEEEDEVVEEEPVDEDDSIAEDEDEPIEDEVPAEPEDEEAGSEQQDEGEEAAQDAPGAEPAPAGEPPGAMDRS